MTQERGLGGRGTGTGEELSPSSDPRSPTPGSLDPDDDLGGKSLEQILERLLD